MEIKYETHYEADYWEGKSVYRTANGELHSYHGPGLVWEGWDLIADALVRVCFPRGTNGKTVLDIGCAGSDFGRKLLKRGLDPYGVDISRYAISRTVPVMQGRAVCLDVAGYPRELPDNFPETYDLVLATDFLEHLYKEDLPYAFEWILSKTKPEGLLFFCVAVAQTQNAPFTVPQEFIQKKGEPVPLEWEGTAAAGHVHVRHFTYWVSFFKDMGLKISWERMYLFQMAREAHPQWRATGGWGMPFTWILKKP